MHGIVEGRKSDFFPQRPPGATAYVAANDTQFMDAAGKPVAVHRKDMLIALGRAQVFLPPTLSPMGVDDVCTYTDGLGNHDVRIPVQVVVGVRQQCMCVDPDQAGASLVQLSPSSQTSRKQVWTTREANAQPGTSLFGFLHFYQTKYPSQALLRITNTAQQWCTALGTCLIIIEWKPYHTNMGTQWRVHHRLHDGFQAFSASYRCMRPNYNYTSFPFPNHTHIIVSLTFRGPQFRLTLTRMAIFNCIIVLPWPAVQSMNVA